MHGRYGRSGRTVKALHPRFSNANHERTGIPATTVTRLANHLNHTFTVVATNSVGADPPSQPSVSVAPHGPTPIPSYSVWGLAALASTAGLILTGHLRRS